MASRAIKRKAPLAIEESSSDESEFEYKEDEEEESDDEESIDADTEESESDEESVGDIDEIANNINLKDISDDESDVVDDANDDDLYTKVLNENNLSTENTNEDSYKWKIESISNELEPISSGNNVAKIDEYNYDSSDEEDVLNTIGNIPYEWYKDYVHIGYDVNGRKIIKPPAENEIDEFLRRMDDPTYWRTVQDNLTGQKVVLTDEDVDLVRRIKNSKFPDPSYDPYAPFIDFFSYEKMIHPVTNRPETKASFIPSLSEKRIVSRLVSAIKRARLRPKPKVVKDSQFNFKYDLWEKDDKKVRRHDRYIAAPKIKPPGHEESYNPPPEYLFDEQEKKDWLESEPDERRLNFMPRTYPSLRQVPAYPEFVKERFERCLDLYICPRARKNRVQVNPDDLIPELPKPADLQPFPAIQSMLYLGHEGKTVSVSTEPMGQFFVSGDNTGLLKIFEVLTGRCFKTIQFDEPITCVNWHPSSTRAVISVVVNTKVYIINPGIGQRQIVHQTDEYFINLPSSSVDTDSNEQLVDVEWKLLNSEANPEEWSKGIRIIIDHKYEINQLTWHCGGEYFATVMPAGANKSVVIHHLSKQKSQVPFKKSKDIIKCVRFHPTRAYFFVATKKSVRVYDLIKQDLTKKLIVNTSEVSCMAIHPGGDNIIIGGVDPKVQWFDLDLSTKAYKTLRYHKKSIREVEFHSKYPLFASASEDGTVVVCHGMVYNDLLQNALIVPVKVLKSLKDNSPMIDCNFHPIQPWIFTCSSNAIRLFT
ncbi:Ribosome biogenesis protein 1 [Blomia tropicalis]|nr:Ribosome biogenesis protein 1 [Blomia tropicalis]